MWPSHLWPRVSNGFKLSGNDSHFRKTSHLSGRSRVVCKDIWIHSLDDYEVIPNCDGGPSQAINGARLGVICTCWSWVEWARAQWAHSQSLAANDYWIRGPRSNEHLIEARAIDADEMA